ncbi:DUF86 domain-containing protein [Aquibacillus albus]|uniref:Uncharacterized protein YutE (UPF0331/DUF86 family) n=1 Tax=Aquibacillus albus TaxID=1168171 RepID=A0ABS2MYK4_9BACI|nr:DUF86 domain-containing protein [Aquibacillus albus]MBM7570966.1 uncharacterized protein YutE (UPF0331/DUF86 family) [Aquibacillus albus]
MYFVERDKIESTLLYMEGLLRETENNSFQSFLDKLAYERMVHMTIESMLDVGNMMIDGFIMRDPGSFTDIIDILVDEKVLRMEEGDAYKEVINLRHLLVKDYLQMDHNKLYEVVTKHKQVLELFSQRIRNYLDNETGVATAFSND